MTRQRRRLHKRPSPSDRKPESITCPRCGRTSYNPTDIDEGYCGFCHDWTEGERGWDDDSSGEAEPEREGDGQVRRPDGH